MPRQTTVTIQSDTWTELTAADASVVTLQNQGPYVIEVLATSTSTAPEITERGLFYGPQQGEISLSLADVFLGTSSPVRLWARGSSGGTVWVSHA